MTTVLGLLTEPRVVTERVASVGETQIHNAQIHEARAQSQRKAVPGTISVHDEQIHALVQQLFFRHESGPVRHAGFAPVELRLRRRLYASTSPKLWPKKAGTTWG